MLINREQNLKRFFPMSLSNAISQFRSTFWHISGLILLDVNFNSHCDCENNYLRCNRSTLNLKLFYWNSGDGNFVELSIKLNSVEKPSKYLFVLCLNLDIRKCEMFEKEMENWNVRFLSPLCCLFSLHLLKEFLSNGRGNAVRNFIAARRLTTTARVSDCGQTDESSRDSVRLQFV